MAGLSTSSLDLTHRPRRLRRAEWTRRLVRENVVTTNDLIWPIFIIEGQGKREPVGSMPGVERLSVDEAVRAAVPVFQPQPAALAALASRVKESFDPKRLFNPGRMG